MRRPGGVDQYPGVRVEWILHYRPTLHARNAEGRNVTVDLSPLGTAALHSLFGSHFDRYHVEPPSMFIRTWRRLFGWAYGISNFEAFVLFLCAFVVLAGVCYVLLWRYTELCDTIQDL